MPQLLFLVHLSLCVSTITLCLRAITFWLTHYCARVNDCWPTSGEINCAYVQKYNDFLFNYNLFFVASTHSMISPLTWLKPLQSHKIRLIQELIFLPDRQLQRLAFLDQAQLMLMLSFPTLHFLTVTFMPFESSHLLCYITAQLLLDLVTFYLTLLTCWWPSLSGHLVMLGSTRNRWV